MRWCAAACSLLAAATALRPVADVLQRLEYDRGVDANRFTFYFREAQLPVKVGAAWGDANDRVNGTERMLANAMRCCGIAFASMRSVPFTRSFASPHAAPTFTGN